MLNYNLFYKKGLIEQIKYETCFFLFAVKYEIQWLKEYGKYDKIVSLFSNINCFYQKYQYKIILNFKWKWYNVKA